MPKGNITNINRNRASKNTNGEIPYGRIEVRPFKNEAERDAFMAAREEQIECQEHGTEVVPFDFNGNQVNVLLDEMGDPWFVGREIATLLGYSRPRDAVRDHCKHPKFMKGAKSTPLTSSPRGIKIIPESDVYRLVIHSKLPAAEKFEAWVMEEVLPSVRKHGAYMTHDVMERILQDPDMAINLIQEIKAEREKRRKLEEEKRELEAERQALEETNAAYKPKVETFDKLTDTGRRYYFNEVAPRKSSMKNRGPKFTIRNRRAK